MSAKNRDGHSQRVLVRVKTKADGEVGKWVVVVEISVKRGLNEGKSIFLWRCWDELEEKVCWRVRCEN